MLPKENKKAGIEKRIKSTTFSSSSWSSYLVEKVKLTFL